MIISQERSDDMRKNVIYAEYPCEGSPMYFWYFGEQKKEYLFSISFHPTIYQFFKNGKSIKEMRRGHVWKRNMQLDRLIERRIPHEMKRLKGKGEENGADRYYKRKKKCPERP